MTEEHRLRDEASKGEWVTIERPGFFGKKRQELEKHWNETYGEGNWRLIWETPQGRVLTFEGILLEYVKGYAEYFKQHPDEAEFATTNYSFAYDKDEISKEQAFDPYALYNKPGVANQFHHVAFNLALEKVLGIPFKG